CVAQARSGPERRQAAPPARVAGGAHAARPDTAGASRDGADGPRLALIIDDWGCCDTAAGREILALEAPLTLAVIPGQPHSRRFAALAAPGRREVILHLPMEAEGRPGGEAAAGPDELTVGLAPDEVARRLDEALDSVPGATAVSGHRGSRATADSSLMDALMGALAARRLPFLDSLTTPRSVVAAAAGRHRVPCLANRIFLDEGDPAPERIRQRLAQLARAARRDGTAIGIGHPKGATAAALAAELPRLRAAGIRLVTLSELRAARDASGVGGGVGAGRD
ncbi:MAG: divergent polysaccharide deacetylase family protein, partial [Candidatus Krumholzibacteriia bacterium]